MLNLLLITRLPVLVAGRPVNCVDHFRRRGQYSIATVAKIKHKPVHPVIARHGKHLVQLRDGVLRECREVHVSDPCVNIDPAFFPSVR